MKSSIMKFVPEINAIFHVFPDFYFRSTATDFRKMAATSGRLFELESRSYT